MSVDLACIIYADADSDELRQLLQQLLPEGGSSFSLIVKNNTIEIVKNLDFDREARLKFPEGFLSFQQQIEIFPIESRMISLEDQIALVSMILRCLWSTKVPAVAACDYEDSLPNNGGYKSIESYQRKKETPKRVNQ